MELTRRRVCLSGLPHLADARRRSWRVRRWLALVWRRQRVSSRRHCGRRPRSRLASPLAVAAPALVLGHVFLGQCSLLGLPAARFQLSARLQRRHFAARGPSSFPVAGASSARARTRTRTRRTPDQRPFRPDIDSLVGPLLLLVASAPLHSGSREPVHLRQGGCCLRNRRPPASRAAANAPLLRDAVCLLALVAAARRCQRLLLAPLRPSQCSAGPRMRATMMETWAGGGEWLAVMALLSTESWARRPSNWPARRRPPRSPVPARPKWPAPARSRGPTGATRAGQRRRCGVVGGGVARRCRH